MNRLRIIRRASNLGDNTSLIIHPASTIYREFTSEEKVLMGVTEGLIRLSVGIETVIANFDNREDVPEISVHGQKLFYFMSGLKVLLDGDRDSLLPLSDICCLV